MAAAKFPCRDRIPRFLISDRGGFCTIRVGRWSVRLVRDEATAVMPAQRSIDEPITSGEAANETNNASDGFRLKYPNRLPGMGPQ
jgi:hypothetical protein